MNNTSLKLLLIGIFTSLSLHAADPINGQIIAAKKCDKCHGEFGISDDTDTPHLASQNSAYAIKQLKDYKSC